VGKNKTIRFRRDRPVWQKVGLVSIPSVAAAIGLMIKDPNLPLILLFLQQCLHTAVVVWILDRKEPASRDPSRLVSVASPAQVTLHVRSRSKGHRIR
jgi:hypothetical protein